MPRTQGWRRVDSHRAPPGRNARNSASPRPPPPQLPEPKMAAGAESLRPPLGGTAGTERSGGAVLAPPARPASAAPAFGCRAPALLSAGIALLLPGGVMRSPIRGLASSDGEEGSDRTPLLQSTPRVEAGEPRSCPRAGVARIPALCQGTRTA